MYIITRQVDSSAATQDDSDGSEEFKWVVAQTVGTFLGLLAIVLAVAALLTERVRRIRADDERRFTSNPSILGCFHAHPVSWFKSLLGKKTQVLYLPTITGLIEIGDKRAWTSSVLDLMIENHSEATWVKLYESITTSIVDEAEESKEATVSSIIKEPEKAKEPGNDKITETPEEPLPPFLNNIKKAHHQQHHIPELWANRKTFYTSKKLIQLHRDLPSGGNPTTSAGPSTSRKQTIKTGLSRLNSAWIVRDKACIGVTREELAALAIIMGVSFPHYPPRIQNSLYLSGVGGFGLSLDISHADTTWSISLAQGSRLPRHAASMGSGYTTMMAKHLACGSVPFAQNEFWILSVYVTDEVYNTIKTGGKIIDKRAFGGDSLEFLRRLPGEKRIDAFYGTGTVDTDGHQPAGASKIEPGDIFHANDKKAGTWSSAVAGIAFGGLVPQASPNVVSAVKFTVGASKLGDCIENLENLIDQLHELDKASKDSKDSTDSMLFGENVEARCSGFGHSFVNYTFPSKHSNTPDAAAIFSRYSNLLERVVALTIGHPKEAAEAWESKAPATSAEQLKEATTIPTNITPGSPITIDDVFNDAASAIHGVYKSAIKSNSADAASRNDKDLGVLLKKVTEKIENKKNFKNGQPVIPLSDCSTIIRCVLAAWAFTVPLIEVRQAEESTLGPSSFKRSESWGDKTPNEIVLSNLPPVSAFC